MSAAITAAVIGVGGGIYMQSQAKKNANQASDKAAQAAAANQIDIPALQAQTSEAAKQNALASQALENQLMPGVIPLQNAATTGILSSMNQGLDPSVQKGRDILSSNLGVPLNTPLLNSAIAKAQADLALGGRLSQDQMNQATRTGAATAGQVAGPGGGLGLGRDLTARDLGLTSYQVEQQRLQNASTIGGQELTQQTSDATNLLNQINTLRAIHDNNFSQQIAAGQYAQSIAPPVVGLDPSAIANLTIANQNVKAGGYTSQANIAGAQSQADNKLSGQLLGYGVNALPGAASGIGNLLGYNNTPTFAPGTTITGPGGAPSGSIPGGDISGLVMS